MALPLLHVAAALIVEDGKIFIGRRKPTDSNPGKWEFPGGKIEEGESPEQAIEREIREELGIEVKVLRFYDETRFSTPKANFHLAVYLCQWKSGELQLLEHSEHAWIGVGDLTQYDFLSGDQPFVTRLQREGLPRP